VRWAWLTGIIAAAAYLATGWVVVKPGEQVVVRRLGKALRNPWGPGPHFGLPVGIDSHTRVRTDEVRRLSVGRAGAPGSRDEPGAGEFLTGDLNIVRAEATVQYRVSDPLAFVTRSRAVEHLLERLATAELGRAFASRGIDAILREGRAETTREAERELNRAVDRLGLGFSILGISLTDARPPTEVAPEFASAQSAGSERDRRVNEAETYASTTKTAANAQSRARLEQARGRADRTLALARARADRFLALLEQTNKARASTIRRIYLDAVRELLPKVRRTLVLTPDEPLDLSILGVGR
jgi:membrane protease subunit HflK